MVPYQYNLSEWLSHRSFILSTSVREGCPVGVLEGMERGLKPLVRNWVGAEDIFKEEWIYNSINDLETLLYSNVNPKEYHKFVADNHSFDEKIKQIEVLIDPN